MLCRAGGSDIWSGIVGNKQYDQGSVIDLWTICLFGLYAIQVHLGNPVAFKEVQDIGNIKPRDCWLSCCV